MNRHQRRAQAARTGVASPSVMTALDTLKGLQEFSNIAERLQPYLAEIETLGAKLDEAKEQLSTMETALTRQREVFLHLVARGMSTTIEYVTKLEASINQELYGGQDGVATVESTEAVSEEANPST